MSDERLIDREPQSGDGADKALRPRRFDEFVGQAELVANLQVFVTAAGGRGEAL
ncbi:MAG: Holliday junction branch migration DNA helicase RuvB, partial [Robiginitomaculum sp.]|nr:Holliday junction branch migration DNA helicase RuvB [Robiginitomaculum sp.]